MTDTTTDPNIDQSRIVSTISYNPHDDERREAESNPYAELQYRPGELRGSGWHPVPSGHSRKHNLKSTGRSYWNEYRIVYYVPVLTPPEGATGPVMGRDIPDGYEYLRVGHSTPDEIEWQVAPAGIPSRDAIYWIRPKPPKPVLITVDVDMLDTALDAAMKTLPSAEEIDVLHELVQKIKQARQEAEADD